MSFPSIFDLLASMPARALDIPGLEQYYNSPTFSDIVIRIGNYRIQAHKMILSLSTPYFRSAFTRGFVESGAKEMQLYDDDPDAAAGMIRYIYGADYRGATTDPGPDYYLRIFAVAGKYDVQGLAQEATKQAKHEPERLVEDPASFSQLVRVIFTDIPEHGGELRSVARETCWKNLTELMKAEDFKELLRAVPELSFELLEGAVEEKKMLEAVDALRARAGPRK